jgi:hypothetical protein
VGILNWEYLRIVWLGNGAARQPERRLVAVSLPPGVGAIAVAFTAGSLIGSLEVGLSAALGIALVLVYFAVTGLSLAWAGGISMTVFQAVALVGYPVRLAAAIAVLYLLRGLAWISGPALSLAAIPAAVLLLGTECFLLARGLGVEFAHRGERHGAKEVLER